MEVHRTAQEAEEKILAEKQDLYRHIHEVLKTPSGEKLFKYLFDEFGVGETPDHNLRDDMLVQETTYFAAGNIIYKLAVRASPKRTFEILTQIEEEREKQNV